jgi:hypothetical protein
MACFLCNPCCTEGESVGLSMYPLLLLGNGSVNTFPWKRGIVRGDICAVRANKQYNWVFCAVGAEVI